MRSNFEVGDLVIHVEGGPDRVFVVECILQCVGSDGPDLVSVNYIGSTRYERQLYATTDLAAAPADCDRPDALQRASSVLYHLLKGAEETGMRAARAKAIYEEIVDHWNGSDFVEAIDGETLMADIEVLIDALKPVGKPSPLRGSTRRTQPRTRANVDAEPPRIGRKVR